MKKNIKDYKDLCDEILSILGNADVDNDKLDKCFEKRQIIIDRLSEENKIDDFRVVYKEELLVVDEKIKQLLQGNIENIKENIKKQRQNSNMNFTYVNMSKNKFNIFSKKV